MKHLLTVILIVATAVFICTNCRNGSDTSSALLFDTVEEELIDTVIMAEEVEPAEIEPAEVVMSKYYGDTLYQYSGKTLVYDYDYNWDWDSDPYSLLSSSAIVTYSDTIPVAVCSVVGDKTWVVNGDYIDFAVGVDTVSYPLRNLPKTINPDRRLLKSRFNVAHHACYRSFALTDSSRVCDFVFDAYLPKHHPRWLRQFIAIVMRNDIQAMFFDNKGIERLINEYCGITKTPPKISGINATSMTPEQIAEHFVNSFETHYKKKFTIAQYDGVGPKYDYMLTLAPAWESSDKKFITYRFYSYYYTSGAHGYMEEYYLTFEAESGRLLGKDDIFAADGFDRAIEILEHKLGDHRNTYTTGDGRYPAHLDEAELESNTSEIIKEIKDSVYYPRPALTSKGVVFSYQPYEKGAFSEGALHFPIPYSQLHLKLKR